VTTDLFTVAVLAAVAIRKHEPTGSVNSTWNLHPYGRHLTVISRWEGFGAASTRIGTVSATYHRRAVSNALA
jgi:hypothetical protein